MRPSRLLAAVTILGLAVLAFWGCAQDGLLMGVCGDGVVDPFSEECDGGSSCDVNCNIIAGDGVLPTLASIQENIFTPYCATFGCHNGTPGNPMRLDSEDESYENLVNFPFAFYCAVRRVEPGKPDESCIVWKTEGSSQAGGDPMPRPPAPPLSQDKIDAIREWILLGAPRGDTP